MIYERTFRRKTMQNKALTYTLSIIICLALGIGSGFISQNSFDWYHALAKPVFNPPDWIFGPVWTVLYIMMGIVLGHLILYPTSKTIWFIFVFQLLCNLLWSPLFFYFHKINFALLDLTLLWGSLIVWLILNRSQGLRLYLFLPYVLWVSFAFLLNIWIYKLNVQF